MKEADLKALRDAAQNTVYGDKGCDLEAFHSLATLNRPGNPGD